jgi:hypothetical protein
LPLREPRQYAAGLRQNSNRDPAVGLPSTQQRAGRFMPSPRDIDRRNDAKLLTPLLVMALVIAAGVLYYALTGHALAG